MASDKQQILDLYNMHIRVIKNKKDPLIHLNSESYRIATGIIMRERIAPDSSVLDVGCATGSPLEFIDPAVLRSLEYEGIDINKNLLEIAKERYKDYPNLSFEEGDINTIEGSYDYIFMNDVLAYFCSEEIVNIIDRYYRHTNVLLSFSLLFDRNYDKNLLIAQREWRDLVCYFLQKYEQVVIDRAAYPDRLRIDIYKGETKHEDLRSF